MEFEKEGGAGATPYEVLLHAALVGDASHFTRQDNVEECWRVLQPLLDAPPTVIPYAQGSWGPAEAEKLHRRVRRLARSLAAVLPAPSTAAHRTPSKRVDSLREPPRELEATTVRLSLSSIIWLIVGVILASSHHYLNHVNAIKPVVSACWPSSCGPCCCSGSTCTSTDAVTAGVRGRLRAVS